MIKQKDSYMTEQLSASEAYDLWAATYDMVPNKTRDAAMAMVRAWTPHIAGRTVLEIGCGTGLNTEHLAQFASHVVGLDFSQGMLAVARQRLQGIPVDLRRHDLSIPLPLADASLDLVLESLVLEHIENLASLFREVARVLKPGGLLLASELHPYRQLLGRQARFVTGCEGKDEVRIEAFGHTISELVNLAVSASLRIVELQETYDPSGEPRLFSFVATKA
ncbi:MAG TPA: class I SAM-dependent methyltransferase [Bradyrhizobium sp.]|nr:class I SAM-dependent methyltransferase [Bradyrhizobium sp.]